MAFRGKGENEAFEALKNQLAEASIMAFYVKDAPTEVVTDASPVGLGAILVQEKQGVKRAVAFASRAIQPDREGGPSGRLGL